MSHTQLMSGNVIDSKIFIYFI